MHYRIYPGSSPSELAKKFGAITWELMNILRENFPSKVSLVQENIERCAPFYVPMSSAEETRRMLSCILSIKDEVRPMTLDEVEDVAWTMGHAASLKDYRSLSACLDLINSDRISPVDTLKAVSLYRDCLIEIADSNDMRQLQSNKRLACAILMRLDQLEEERQATEGIPANRNRMNEDEHLS